MSIIKEKRQFFLRSTAVFVGSDKDKELNFPTQYYAIVDGKSVKVYNRFLKGHYPSEDVNKKLFESLTFKLNAEDTATSTEQGLVSLATNAEILAGTDVDSNGFALTIKPSQLNAIAAYILSNIGGNKMIYNNTAVLVNSDIADAEEILNTFVLPANALVNNGDEIEIEGLCHIKDNTFTTLKLYSRLNTLDINLFSIDTSLIATWETFKFNVKITKFNTDKINITSELIEVYTGETLYSNTTILNNQSLTLTTDVDIDLYSKQNGGLAGSLWVRKYSITRKPLLNIV